MHQGRGPGQIIDGFRLLDPLQSGGMASFWRVSREGTDLPLLMKLPLLRPGEDPLTIIGYEVEMMILPRLSGRHVPRFIAAGDFERPYIVMEFIDGQSLKSLLEKTPLPENDVAAIGAKIAFALHDIHHQHVIHLDLKPSNVILRGNNAVLIDFGLSRHDQLPDLVQEDAEGPVGTGAYIAPEQVLGERTDPRSDLFALGVVLYFLATGNRPFGEPQSVDAWRRRLWRDPKPPRVVNPAVQPWLQEIILRCLEVDPGEPICHRGTVGLRPAASRPSEIDAAGHPSSPRRHFHCCLAVAAAGPESPGATTRGADQLSWRRPDRDGGD